MTVKRVVVFIMIVAGISLAVRKIAGGAGPEMRERCAEMCDRMLDNMPESFPPNRMMADLEALKERTARILEVLEERGEVDGQQEQ
jgi:hypothetical protein